MFRIRSIFVQIPVAIVVLFLSGCQPEQVGKLPKAERMAMNADWLQQKYADPATGRIPHDMQRKQADFVRNRFGFSKAADNIHAEEWKSLGPFNLGGRTRAVAFDVADPTHIVAGGVSGGLWNSYDMGGSWTKASLSVDLHSITYVAQDTRPGSEHIWYACSGEVMGNSAGIPGNGILKSADNGQTWQLLASTSIADPYSQRDVFSNNTRVATNPATPEDDVYVATFGKGIWRSVDGGESFEHVLGSSDGQPHSSYSDVVVTSSGILFAFVGVCDNKGLYTSSNGTDWELITPEVLLPFDLSRTLLAYSEGSGELFVLASSQEHGNSEHPTPVGLFVRDSDGEWQNRTANLPSISNGTAAFNTQYNYNLLLAVHPQDPNVVMVGEMSLYRSTDGFASPQNTERIGGYHPQALPTQFWVYPGSHCDQHLLAFHPTDPDVAINGHDGGLSLTQNIRAENVEWEYANNGYVTSQLYVVDIDQESTSRRMVAGFQDRPVYLNKNIHTEDDWHLLQVDGDGVIAEIANDGSGFYGGRQISGPIYKFDVDSDGNVLHRTRIDPGLMQTSWKTPFAQDPTDHDVVYFGTSNIFRGVSYLPSVSSLPLDFNAGTASRCSTILSFNSPAIEIAVAVVDDKRVLYAVEGNFLIYRVENPLQESRTTYEYPLPGGTVSSIAIDENDPMHIYVSVSNYNIISVYESLDGGENFHSISGNLEEFEDGTGSGPGVEKIVPVSKDGVEYLVALTTAGTFVTNKVDGDHTIWSWVGSESIGVLSCYDAEFRDSDDWFVVATHGYGIWEGELAIPPAPAVGVPVLLGPTDGQNWINDRPTLAWQKAEHAALHELQYATNSEFADATTIKGVLSDTIVVDVSMLQPGDTVYWRVRGENATSLGAFSSPFSFTLEPSVLLTSPPDDGVTPVTLNTELRWEHVAGAASYNVVVSSVPSLLIKTEETTGISTTSYICEQLEAGTRYYWQVEALNAEGLSIQSETWSFKTEPEMSVEPANQSSFSVFPNPAGNTITVSSSTSGSLIENIEVYNERGAMVLSKRNLALDRVSLQVSSLPVGAYTIVVSSDRGQRKTLPFVVHR